MLQDVESELLVRHRQSNEAQRTRNLFSRGIGRDRLDESALCAWASVHVSKARECMHNQIGQNGEQGLQISQSQRRE